MGVVNITPDSFSDGGRFFDSKAAVAHARQLVRDGADLIDIGGESTRPGAAPVSLEEELKRILPVVNDLADLPVSVDTRRPEVMQAALVMHKKGEPATMQQDPHYDDVVGEVKAFLKERIDKARGAGIAASRIVVDPGFGFGKTAQHNLELLRRLNEFLDLKVPLLAGWSRKSTLGKITGRPVEERLAGSLAMALLALQGGAKILRVHDVRETRDVIAVWQAYQQ